MLQAAVWYLNLAAEWLPNAAKVHERRQPRWPAKRSEEVTLTLQVANALHPTPAVPGDPNAICVAHHEPNARGRPVSRLLDCPCEKACPKRSSALAGSDKQGLVKSASIASTLISLRTFRLTQAICCSLSPTMLHGRSVSQGSM